MLEKNPPMYIDAQEEKLRHAKRMRSARARVDTYISKVGTEGFWFDNLAICAFAAESQRAVHVLAEGGKGRGWRWTRFKGFETKGNKLTENVEDYSSKPSASDIAVINIDNSHFRALVRRSAL